MDASVEIREATVGDEATLALVGAATFLESFAGVLDGDDIVAHCHEQHAPQVYARWLQDESSRAWLAQTSPGGAPVGYLVMARADLPLADLGTDDWEIKRVYVLGRFQSQGIGRELAQRALAEARRRQGRRILLGVYGRNDRAIGFYRHLGFSHVGVRTFRVGRHVYDDLILGLPLH